MTTDIDKDGDPDRDKELWPFETITPEDFYALPLAYRLAVQKMVRDMVDGTRSEH